MSENLLISNILFLLITTYIFFKSFNDIANYRSCTIADYVISLIYAFNCLPVLFDVTVGIPDYVSWFNIVEYVLKHETVSVIYNIYVTLTLLVLYSYKKKKDRWRDMYDLQQYDEFNRNGLKANFLIILIIALPFLFALIKYDYTILFQYTSLKSRGIESEYSVLINFFILVSSFLSVTLFVGKQKKPFWMILLFLVYLFAIVYLNGKRYIIVTLLLMLLFCYEQRSHLNIGKRLNLKFVYALIAVGVVFFSVYYFATVKAGHSANDYLYSTLRMDFGRDDVTKFVILRELVEDKPILDYPGQTILSTLFVWVPRSIWPDKPYPHYRYLTAALLNTSVLNIPAGTTPSVYEQSIANLGVFGIIFTCILLLYLCKWTDNVKSLNVKLLLLLLIVNLLTQAFDASFGLLILLLANSMYTKITKKRLF